MSGRAPAGAVAAATGGAPSDAQNRQQQQAGMSSTIKNLLQIFLFMQVFQYGTKYLFGSGPSATTPSADPAASGASKPVQSSVAASGQPPKLPNVVPLWPQGTQFDAHMYISASPHGQINFNNPDLPHVSYEGLTFGDWTWKEEWNTEIKLPKSVQNNGSLYLDVFLARDGASVNPRDSAFNLDNIHHMRKPLVRYQRLKRERAVRNLLSSQDSKEETEETEEEAKEKDAAMPIVSYYHPNITIAVVSNSGEMAQAAIVPVIAQYVRYASPAPDSDKPRYYPIIWPNTFWQMKASAYPLNSTVDAVPISVTFEPAGHQKFQIVASLDESFAQAAEKPGMGAGAADLDEVKRIFLETNPLLLGVTILVTILHSIFEFLAFKNDVTHWKNQKSNVGVSVRTIITNVIVQLIITLYLLDNNQETSYMILLGQGMGLLIEAWKITKAVDIKLVRQAQGLLPFKIEFHDKHVLTQEEKATQEYDKLAFKYVTWGTTPLLIGYTIYSLLYDTHKGWYSFVISTLTSFVYAFGFIQLIPQLIINYKLKSVAHMPIRSLTYKALNTVVDDFFSFVIRMPLLHRLACFRDDVVFVVLLYQYYIYPVDKTRANEYGQKLEATEKDRVEPEKEDNKAKAIQETKKNK